MERCREQSLGGGGAESGTDAVGAALGGTVAIFAPRAFDDRIERGEQGEASLLLLVGAGAAAGADSAELLLIILAAVERGGELGLLFGQPFALGEPGNEFGLGGFAMAGGGEGDGVFEILVDKAGLAPARSGGGGGGGRGCGGVWNMDVWWFCVFL